MLKDELQVINAIFRETQQTGTDRPVRKCDIDACFSSRLQKALKAVNDAWTKAAFSEAPECSLQRYFQFHLNGIRQLSDTIFDLEIPKNEQYKLQLDEINAGLISLIRLMADNFTPYFDRDSTAPHSFHIETFAALTDNNVILQKEIASSRIDASLKQCIVSYLGGMVKPAPETQYTFGSLFYYQNFVKTLAGLQISRFDDRVDQQLAEKLVSLNFNQLDFISYKQKAILDHAGSEFNKLKKSREYYQWRLPETEPCYPSWPSVTFMLTNWLDEELAEMKRLPVAIDKLSLNLSVAHLACITRLFFEENIYSSQALTAIFKFIAGHFQTKRQTRISTGSLSKEYYSINQVTAAVVRDKLLKMVARINHDYFPVMVAIAGASLVHLAAH